MVEEKICHNSSKTIYGLLYTPQSIKEKIPLVILSHGYNSSHADVSDIAKRLVELGIAAYCFDFCGGSISSKSDGKTTGMSIHSEVEDLKAVYSELKTLDFVDQSNIFFYGESQGGFVSALAAMESPCEPAGLILLYPAFCIPDNWPRDTHKDFPETFDFMGMELSKVFLNGLPEVDAYEYIKSFDKPVLIFHGDADSLVDISYSERLNKTYKNSTLVICKNEGHGFSPEVREIEINKIIDYLKEIIKY